MKHCSNCGAVLEIRMFERQRMFCPQCQRIQYAQLKVGAGALIEQNGSLLLLQRTLSAFQGSWNIPAGFVEVDEGPLDAVVRETFEETGLQVAVKSLVDIYFFADDPRGNGILIVYACQPIGGELQATEEAINPAFFSVDEIPENLAGGGHNQAVHAWMKKGTKPVMVEN